MKELKLQSEKQKQYIIEQTWLLYFNQTLFEQGLITEEERNHMANWIKIRKNLSG